MFNLERLERQIMAVLIMALLAGMAVTIHKKNHRHTPIRVGRFDMEEKAVEELNGRIDINKADAEELAKLKGIGKAMAGRIIEHRSTKGLFLSIEEIKNVKGIGDAMFGKIKDDITIE